MLLCLWRSFPPWAVVVFHTTSDSALCVSAAVPVRHHQLAACHPRRGEMSVGRWKVEAKEKERETSTGQERGLSPGQSISEPLWSHKKNCSKSCTLASISIRRLHIASMQSHIVTWYHIQSCRLITQLTLEMDRSRAQEIDLANILPSCLPTSLLSKFMVKIFFYFVAPMLGLQQRLFSLFITLSVSLSMRILQQRQLDLW